MSSSDDESEAVPENVSEYEFVSGEDDESVSFTVLPLEWSEGETRDVKPEVVFLSGKTDNGLQKIYKRVIAWKFDLPYKKPVVSVLSAEGYWIELLNPRKAFHGVIRTIEVTLQLLHFVKWNSQLSQKALWDHLTKTFSMFERRPCEDDLADHLPLIDEVVKRDVKLVNSKILSTILAKKPWERKTSIEGVKPPPFIVDDVNEEEDQGESDGADENEDDGSDEDGFDSVCAFCDNGGNMYICDGKCMRSFHATPEDATLEDGGDPNCETLGLTVAELDALKDKDTAFYCGNCKYKHHQCYACGALGSSDESSSPEVFCCVNGTCGYFYHPHCVAKLLQPGNSAAAEELEQSIAAGEQFACPAHRCHVCKEVEVRSVKELQFAVCRRCPRAYHRKCLPREITYEEDVDEDNKVVRAWEGLIPNRVLIYCLDHEIDPEIHTPTRDHIKFPPQWLERNRKQPLEPSMKKNILKKRGLSLEDSGGKKISAKPSKVVDNVSSRLVRDDISKKRVKNFPVQASSKKQKVATNGNSLVKLKESRNSAGGTSLGGKLYDTSFGIESEVVVSSSGVIVRDKHEIIQEVKPTAKRIDDSLTVDADSRRRILALMDNASSLVTLKNIQGMHTSPSTHVQSRSFVENITLGKAEGSVQALRTALKKLNDGGCIQDARVVCGDDLLHQVSKWKDKLKVYLAPFLHGMRYTSFGRHFTKMDKLKQIVDILHWYVQDGDVVVDFCCGSNDFSWLMKKKLDEMGKTCLFKNYDILQPKNDFNFERRDWMGVKPDELPDGSQLIMGLNPPFGVKGALANRFINKALEFKPKLLILIVPRETQRLDKKESPYDLIWEDDQMLVGKSFYLPGSVDVNDKQIEDWNMKAPILYLWSSPDWTPKHTAIAEQHCHHSGALKNLGLDESHNAVQVPISAQECSHPVKSLVNHSENLHSDTPENPEQNDRGRQESLPREFNGSEGGKSHPPSKNHTAVKNYSKRKEFGGKGKRNRRSMEENSSSRLPVTRHLSPKHHETPSRGHSVRSDYQQPINQRNSPRYNQTYPQTGYPQTGYGVNDGMDDLVRKYTLNAEESMTSRQVYGPGPPPDYGLWPPAPTDQWRGPRDGRANSFNHRSYMGDVNEDYERKTIFQSHINIHAREEPNSWNQRITHPPFPGPAFPSPYGQLNPVPNFAYGEIGTSAMQRYAPRLNEFHHTGMTNIPPVAASPIHPPPPRPAFQDTLGFAPGQYHSFSQNSSGWLYE